MSHNLKRLLIAVYICLVCLLAIATFLEQACGTDFVEKYIYHTFWFCCLWGILAALAVMALIRRQLWKHLPTLLLHGSFLGGSHAYVCQQPERICAPYRRK